MAEGAGAGKQSAGASSPLHMLLRGRTFREADVALLEVVSQPIAVLKAYTGDKKYPLDQVRVWRKGWHLAASLFCPRFT